MTYSSEILFSLLRHALGSSSEFGNLSALSKQDWKDVIDLVFDQGVAAIAVDGLGLMMRDCPDLELEIDKEELEDLKYEWFGACFENEQTYVDHLKTIGKLASLYGEHSMRMMLLKGYGLSLNYPVPEHRTSGDIDIYLYGKGGLGDSLVREHFGCEVKQNEDKHSVFALEMV